MPITHLCFALLLCLLDQRCMLCIALESLIRYISNSWCAAMEERSLFQLYWTQRLYYVCQYHSKYKQDNNRLVLGIIGLPYAEESMMIC